MTFVHIQHPKSSSYGTLDKQIRADTQHTFSTIVSSTDMINKPFYCTIQSMVDDCYTASQHQARGDSPSIAESPNNQGRSIKQ